MGMRKRRITINWSMAIPFARYWESAGRIKRATGVFDPASDSIHRSNCHAMGTEIQKINYFIILSQIAGLGLGR
jgi:hypothetical protein